MSKILNSVKNFLFNDGRAFISQIKSASFHTTSILDANWNRKNRGAKNFLEYNKKIFTPITDPENEKPRPAFVCHMKKDLKYSPKKMWYISSFIRGMTIDEAIKQLNHNVTKGAMLVKQALLEAQELAVKRHNVEFKSNLWVAESFCGKGFVVKGIRRHARARVGHVEYKHVHYFVRLEEGVPPKQYYLPHLLTPEQQLDKWVEDMRKRKITNSL